MTTKEKIEIMQAYENGKKIEWRPNAFKRPWNDYLNEPEWNWEYYQYRIKPEEPNSIPATEEELEIIGRGVLWCRNKKNPNRMGWIRHNDTLNKSDWLLFNSDTKCWEDWKNK